MKNFDVLSTKRNCGKSYYTNTHIYPNIYYYYYYYYYYYLISPPCMVFTSTHLK